MLSQEIQEKIKLDFGTKSLSSLATEHNLSEDVIREVLTSQYHQETVGASRKLKTRLNKIIELRVENKMSYASIAREVSKDFNRKPYSGKAIELLIKSTAKKMLKPK